MTALKRITDALTAAGSTGRGTAYQCPAHDDRAPSLSIHGNAAGTGVVVKCHAGCDTDAVMDALGLRMADLYDEPRAEKPHVRPQQVAEYPYVDEHGEVLRRVRRYEPGFDGQRKTFRQFGPDGTPGVKGIRKVPYDLPGVIHAAAAGEVVAVVEGEKDADRLRSLGMVATTNIGGAGKWDDEYSRFFVGVAEAVVIADRDEPGRKHAAQVAESLRRAGVPVRVVEPAAGKDVSDHIDAGKGFEDLVPVTDTGVPDKTDTTSGASRNADGARRSVSSVRQWEDPVSIDRPTLPVFPVDVLGANLSRMVAEAARSTQVAVDMPTIMALACISTAIGGRATASIRPGWSEPVVLWTVGVALPGERKTGVEDLFTAPLREEEVRLRMAAEPVIEETGQRRRIAEERLKEAERAAVKAKPDTAALAADDAALALKTLQDIGEPPALPSLFWGDITPAAMPVKAAENNGRGAVIDSEGVFFANVTGRRFGNGSPDTTFALRAYDGKAVPVHRIQRGSTELTTAHLTLGLLVQPVILEALARSDNDEVLNNGFVQRPLYSYPESNLGRRDPRAAMPVSEYAAADYDRRIKNLVAKLWEAEAPRFLAFTPEANEVMYQFEEHIEPRMAPLGDLHGIMSWASKLPGKLARIATALTLYDNSDATQVTGEYMTAAVSLAPYFIRHARVCLDLMGANREAQLTPARDVLEWLRGRNEPGTPFTIRDVQRGVQRKWALDGGADAVRGAVAHLADLGWVEPQEPDPAREGKPGRKPSPRYDVHPWIANPPRPKEQS